MVPKLAAKGVSFKGAAAYYLHDKGASTDERVAWSATLNLATQNPETAWRIMAATARDQSRLKEEAGIRSTGRKSADVVLAYSLAWHPDEKEGLTREDMMLAARASITALGAEHCQAIIVAHQDEPHPHLHIILNRVSPQDGRMLSSSKEKLNLSRWAEAYERGRGKILCEERVANNEAREKLQEFVRGRKDKTRNQHETTLPRESLAMIRIREAQRMKDAALAAAGRDLAARHSSEWDELRKTHKERRQAILANTRADMRGFRADTREAALPLWRLMHKRHFAEQHQFNDREKRVSGKIHNAIAAIKSMGAVRGDASARGFLGNAFQYLTSSANRQQALTKRQEMEKDAFTAEQRRTIAAAMSRFRSEQRTTLERNVLRLQEDRQALKESQTRDRQDIRTAWRDRNQERSEARSKIEASRDLRREVTRSFAREAPAERSSRER